MYECIALPTKSQLSENAENLHDHPETAFIGALNLELGCYLDNTLVLSRVRV